MSDVQILTLSCRDRPGITARVTTFLFEKGGNVIEAQQFNDLEDGDFFMRVAFDPGPADPEALRSAFGPLAAEFGMRWNLRSRDKPRKVLLMVSKFDHCLADLLYRHHAGELYCDIPLIISNHPDTHWLAAAYKIPFQHIQVTKENKMDAERQQRALLAAHHVDFFVLARYMQVLSPEFMAHYPNRIINIHHSFLPAFHGAKPYQRAFERGVKLIGATSHYVTEVLDDGPIIEQDVTRISHRDDLENLVQKGADMEKVVLSRAVKWHIDNRILVYGNKTVVFD